MIVLYSAVYQECSLHHYTSVAGSWYSVLDQ